MGELEYGHSVHWTGNRFLCLVVGLGRAVRAVVRRRAMSALYLIAGLIALALFGYLVVALLKPEIF